jgi:hypothetical protein
MKTIDIPVSRAKDFLADRMVHNLLQTDEMELIRLVRYDGIGGFEKMSNEEIFAHLANIFSEFKLIQLVSSTKNLLVVGVKDEYAANEKEILVDIARMIQTKFY